MSNKKLSKEQILTLKKYQIEVENIAKNELKQELEKKIKELRKEYKHLQSSKLPFYETVESKEIEENIVRCPDPQTAQKMINLIEEVKEQKDSIGGTIQGIIRNCPVGLGEPEFDKLPAELAKAMMSINATKGFEIGSGFIGSKRLGSQHNDKIMKEEDSIKFASNNSGGVLAGISSGQTIHFKVAIKPVATIGKAQKTIDKDGNLIDFEGKGRHDPCVLPRAVPIVEAMSAIVIMDMYLRNQKE